MNPMGAQSMITVSVLGGEGRGGEGRGGKRDGSRVVEHTINWLTPKSITLLDAD